MLSQKAREFDQKRKVDLTLLFDQDDRNASDVELRSELLQIEID